MKEPVHIQLDLPVVGFSDSSFVDQGKRWEASTLYEAAEDLPEFELPLAGIDLGVMPWQIQNIFKVAEHFNRVIKADLRYPILLDEYGYICDGWHRLVKALILKRTHIRAKRLPVMPEPDELLSDEMFEKEKS